MATIKDLQQVDITKISNEQIKKWVLDLTEDYKQADDKNKMQEIAQDSIDKVYQMITKFAPDALPEEDCPCDEVEDEKIVSPASGKKKSKKKGATKKKAPKKKESAPKPQSKPSREATKKKLAGINEEIQACRLKIKKYNNEKRKEEGPKPVPSRYAKIKGHLVSIGNLIPDKLKKNLEVQKKTESILLRAHRQIIDTYGMSELKAKKDQEAIKEKYDRLEDQLSK